MPCVCNNGESFIMQQLDQASDYSVSLQTVQTCGVCAAGSYFANDTCSLCPVGYYSEEGQTKCQVCPNGYFSTRSGWSTYQSDSPGATFCVKCLAGMYSNAGEVCRGCPAGYDSGEALGMVGNNYVGYEPATAQGVNTYCALCPQGWSWVWGTVGVAVRRKCLRCNRGMYENKMGTVDTSERNGNTNWFYASCKTCPSGYFAPMFGAESQDQCTACIPGRFATYGTQNGCEACPVGYFNVLSAQSECVTCFAGKFTTTTGNTVCKTCVAGKYQNQNDHTGCAICTAGRFQDQIGQSGCKACPAGQYQNQNGQSGCKSCPAGYHQNLNGQSGCKTCIPHYQNEIGQANCKQCVSSFKTCTQDEAAINCFLLASLPCP